MQRHRNRHRLAMVHRRNRTARRRSSRVRRARRRKQSPPARDISTKPRVAPRQCQGKRSALRTAAFRDREDQLDRSLATTRCVVIRCRVRRRSATRRMPVARNRVSRVTCSVNGLHPIARRSACCRAQTHRVLYASSCTGIERPRGGGASHWRRSSLGSTAGSARSKRLALDRSFADAPNADVRAQAEPATSGHPSGLKVTAPMTGPKVQQTQLVDRAQ